MQQSARSQANGGPSRKSKLTPEILKRKIRLKRIKPSETTKKDEKPPKTDVSEPESDVKPKRVPDNDQWKHAAHRS